MKRRESLTGNLLLTVNRIVERPVVNVKASSRWSRRVAERERLGPALPPATF